MSPRKIIIDTDPGCDDILAMLLAFSALPDELQVLMLSVTYGNVDVESCLKNVVSLFYHIEKELAWRQQSGLPLGFDTLRSHKPIVAAGPSHPLAEQMLMADFFHGRDGLGDINVSHPHLTPTDTWEELLKHAEQSTNQSDALIVDELKKHSPLFTPSHVPAHEEILRLLRQHEPDTITIVAIGPLTNLAIAAATDPDTFLRTKEVVVMGGAVEEPGNITPKAEFNTFADSIAAARLYALSSPDQSSTMPPQTLTTNELPPYPPNLSGRLRITLFPLDTTNYHLVTRGQFQEVATPLEDKHSPLAQWVAAWLEATFRKIESLHPGTTRNGVGLQLHDPLTIWYCMTADDPKWQLVHNEDLRVETTGQWTRGMCVVDRRDRKKRDDKDTSIQPGDHGDWIRGSAGNRLSRCLDSPGREVFGPLMLHRIFHP